MSQIAEALIERGHDVYFVTNNDEYNGHKGSKILTEIGCKNQIFTQDHILREWFFKKPESMKKVPENLHFPVWEQMFKDEIIKIEPDIIVCDFFTRVGVHIADELKIPCVINIPGLMSFWDTCGLSGVFYYKNASSCCGIVCIGEKFKAFSVRMLFGYINKRRMNYYSGFNERMVLFNSFWGLDEPTPVPPNYVLTGPLSKPQGDLLKSLESKDPELLKWLDEAHENG